MKFPNTIPSWPPIKITVKRVEIVTELVLNLHFINKPIVLLQLVIYYY